MKNNISVKFFIFLIFTFFFNYKVYAKPRCEVLYDRIYNKGSYKDVSIVTDEKQKTIGIKLKKYWNETKLVKLKNGKEIQIADWELERNKDGYFKIGKITDGDLSRFSSPGKIEIGDVILSINDKDLREIAKDPAKLKIIEKDVSDLFQKDEKIKFKLLKNNKIIEVNKINQFGVNEYDIKNKILRFNQPIIDFYANSIIVDEKSGSFTAAIDYSFHKSLDKRYSLNAVANDILIDDKKFKNGNLSSFHWYQCDFSDERWDKLDTVNPSYGIKINNLISQDNSLKNSHYNLKPGFYEDDKKNGFIVDNAEITYNSSGVYKIKNNFNLRAFPFDKQKLNIHLYNEKFTDDFRASVSSNTIQKALKFKNENNIQGWDIDNVNLKYKFLQNPFNNFDMHDGISLEIEVSRKHGYYIFKIILPILLILSLCWSSVWLPPKEIQSRLTVTIVCLLSLIAYNFVIDADIPKLEYLTIMDFIILISYIYAAIPCLLAVISYNLVCNNKEQLCYKFEGLEKRYGLLSYIVIIIFIILSTMLTNSEHATGLFF
jgi:hypothetical protein